MKTQTSEKLVQSVERTLGILEVMASTGQPMNLSEISNQLNLKVSTVHRLLKTLISKGFAEQDPYTGKYQLGMKTFHIGNSALYALDVRYTARPYLKSLVEKYGETANLAVLERGSVVYIDQVESDKMVKMMARLGVRSPSHSNAVGKVLLADAIHTELYRYFREHSLEKYTANTICKKEELKKELLKVNKQGYAVDLEETEAGIRCVAAPIYNHRKKAVAALGISGPSYRISMDYLNQKLVPAVKENCLEISYRLGYSHSSQY